MKQRIQLLIRIIPICLTVFMVQCTETQNERLNEINPRNGQIIRIPGMDLRADSVVWGGTGNPAQGEEGKTKGEDDAFIFRKGDDGVGYYKVDRSATSLYTIPLLPNRTYVCTMLYYADFPRDSAGRTREVNIGLRTYDGGGKNIIDNLNGIPVNKTNGWERWEWSFTTDPRVSSGRLHINLYNFSNNDVLKFADIAFVELPPNALVPYNKGEGVSFRGGPGNLPMKVVKAEKINDSIVVETTGTRYTFDLARNMMTARQLLEKERNVSIWKLSSSLSGLEILRQNDLECVLVNDHITFGVQCDGLVMVAPHKELILECESKIGGKWNRFAAGHLFCLDEWGGFAVNPAIPMGSGRLARVDAGIRTGRVKGGELDFSGYVDNKTFISSANPGWKVKWNISPGERIAISVFPPRPYPWKESFKSEFALSNIRTPLENYDKLAEFCHHIVMWTFIERGWGSSYSTKFTVRNDSVFKAHIAKIKSLGMTACPYMSPYFYHSRDPKIFSDELQRMKDTYGINGVYYDGIPSQEWIETYEMMRMTREVLKDGVIIFHNTGHASNGTPPLGEVSLKIPAVESYADISYGAELVWGTGADWVYPRYTQPQFRMSNSIGTMILHGSNGGWTGFDSYHMELLLLKYNGRVGNIPGNEATMKKMKKHYFPVKEGLQKLWEEKGYEPDFYDKYFLPEYDRLVRKYSPETLKLK